MFFGLAPAINAHEFWIEPEDYQVAPGQTFSAYLRNGERFKGVSMAYFESRFTRFETVQGDKIQPVSGRLGDSPALQAQAQGDGLLVVLHETTPSKVTYRDWAKFMSFAAHKDFAKVEADHVARNWPKDLFRESYTRHAKALIAVGDGQGADQAYGLETEFVALTNPYAADFDGTMRVLLTYQDAPRANAQVEVFDRALDGTVSVRLYRTDQDGHAAIPVTFGHEYLFDAVVLRPIKDVADPNTDPVWETLWAALTFAVPRQ